MRPRVPLALAAAFTLAGGAFAQPEHDPEQEHGEVVAIDATAPEDCPKDL